MVQNNLLGYASINERVSVLYKQAIAQIPSAPGAGVDALVRNLVTNTPDLTDAQIVNRVVERFRPAAQASLDIQAEQAAAKQTVNTLVFVGALVVLGGLILAVPKMRRQSA